MPNTLGLDDDLDGVEVVRELERVFDVKVSKEEAERIFTVGEFQMRPQAVAGTSRSCSG